MAVSIRLKRFGRKKRAFYRVVVADQRTPRQGKSVDDLGYYDPLKDPAEIQINAEKALLWLGRGAQPTQTARGLLSKAGILQKFHEQKQARKKTETQTIEQSDNGTAEQSDSEREEEP